MFRKTNWLERLDTAERVVSRCKAAPDIYDSEDVVFLEQYVSGLISRINSKDEEEYE